MASFRPQVPCFRMATIARKILVNGRVQGVFFREWTVQQALSLGLSGWVRNRRDGSVEVYAAGEADVLDVLVDRLHEGSPASQVDNVLVEGAELEASTSFVRRQTV